MQQLLLSLVLVLFAASPAAPAPKADALATVHQFVDSFNKGDTKAAAATCADQTVIIDDFPPYEWHGAGSCLKWMDDYGADAAKNKITDGHVTLGTARHAYVSGDRAYIVVPTTYVYKKNGKVVKEIGSTLTVALQSSANSYRITGWAWSKN